MLPRTRHHFSLVILLAVAGSLLLSCAGLPVILEKPRVSGAQLKLETLTLREATLVLTLEIENTSNISLRAGVVEYRIDIAGQRVLDGKTEGSFEIKAAGASKIPLTLVLPYSSIAKAASSLLTGGQASYKVSGSVSLTGLLSGIKIPISHSGTLRRP